MSGSPTPYGVEILNRQVYRGSIMDQITGTKNFLRRNIHCSGRVRGFICENVYEYPIEAVREAILNTVCRHRYIISGRSRCQCSTIASRLGPRPAEHNGVGDPLRLVKAL